MVSKKPGLHLAARSLSPPRSQFWRRVLAKDPKCAPRASIGDPSWCLLEGDKKRVLRSPEGSRVELRAREVGPSSSSRQDAQGENQGRGQRPQGEARCGDKNGNASAAEGWEIERIGKGAGPANPEGHPDGKSARRGRSVGGARARGGQPTRTMPELLGTGEHGRTAFSPTAFLLLSSLAFFFLSPSARALALAPLCRSSGASSRTSSTT